MAGIFNITTITQIRLKLQQLNHTVKIFARSYLTNKLLNYDLILGRDIKHKLSIIFIFENKTITWQEVSISMKPAYYKVTEFFVIKESHAVKYTTKRIKQILMQNIRKLAIKLSYNKLFKRQT